MAQILVPTSDQATGSWTTTPLWSKVDDDSTVNPSGDGTLISSEAVGNNADTSFADLKLATGNTPGAGTQTLRVRWQNGGEGGSGRDIIGHCELWEGDPASGGTKRGEVSAPTLTAAGGEVETTATITGVTDYSALYIRLWGRGSGGGQNRTLQVDLVEFEIPDAAGGTTINMDAGVLDFSGLANTLTRQLLYEPALGALSLDGLDASFTRQLLLAADLGSLVFEGHEFSITSGLVINMALAAFNFEGQTISVTRDLLLHADTGTLNLSGLSSGITRHVPVDMATGALNFSGLDANVVMELVVEMALGTLTVNGFPVDIQTGEPLTLKRRRWKHWQRQFLEP